jgi:hypothetical protein
VSGIQTEGTTGNSRTEPDAAGSHLPDLRFKSYQGDPVARLVIDRFRLTPVALPARTDANGGDTVAFVYVSDVPPDRHNIATALMTEYHLCLC